VPTSYIAIIKFLLDGFPWKKKRPLAGPLLAK